MKLQHLRYFAAVVEDGSITQASHRLHITQPAISAGLKALEDELRQPLFARANGRRVALTTAGRCFYARVSRILADCDAARAEVMNDGVAHRLRLGIIETLPPSAVSGAVAALRAQGRAVEVWQAAPGKLSGWLKQGRIDMAWTVVGDAAGNGRILTRERFVCAVAPGHPFARRPGPVTLAELAAEPFVFRSHCEMSTSGHELIQAAGHRLRVVARVASDAMALQLVAHNLGVTLVPSSLADGGLVTRPVKGLRLVRTLGLQASASARAEEVATVLAALSTSQ